MSFFLLTLLGLQLRVIKKDITSRIEFWKKDIVDGEEDNTSRSDQIDLKEEEVKKTHNSGGSVGYGPMASQKDSIRFSLPFSSLELEV